LKKLSNKEKILKLLKGNKLTVKEIANKTDFNENEVRTYIHRLIKDNLVKTVGKDSRWVNYTAMKQVNKLQTLKNGILELNKLMSITKPKIPSDIDKNKIREAVELCHTI